MTSVRQITANQGNAQRSTGPKTVAGKDRVARNAVTHGILAQSPVLEGVESREAWEAHLAGIEDSLTPIGPGSTCQELSGSVGIGPAGPSGSVRNRQEVSDGEPREALVRSRLF